MHFLTNPFNDADISSNHQNDIIISLNCEVFLWEDQKIQDLDKISQWVLHYYLDEDPKMTNNVDDSLEDIKNSLFINGTDFNQQYFELEFQKDLQYMTIERTELYVREQDP